MSLFSLTNLQWSGSNKADVMSVVDDITTPGSMWENFSYPTDQMFSFCPSLVGPVSSKSPTMSSCLTFRASHQIFFSQPALWIFPVHFTKLPASKKFWMELESKKDKKQNKTKFHGTFVSMVHTIFIYTLNFIYFIKYYNCNQKIGSTFALLFL